MKQNITPIVFLMTLVMASSIILLLAMLAGSANVLKICSTLSHEGRQTQEKLICGLASASSDSITCISYLIGKYEKELQLGQASKNYYTVKGSGSTKAVMVKIKGEGAMSQRR